MSIFLLLSLLIVPLLNAERLQSEIDNNNDMLMQRSMATSYLFGHPIRRHQHQLVNWPADRSSILAKSDRGDQPRAKRIYWENLAFHAADFNQKGKKV